MGYKRVLTAALMIPLLFAIVQYAGSRAFFFLILSGVMVGLYEFYRMFKNSGYRPQTFVGMFVGALVISGFYVGAELPDWQYAKVFSPDVMVAFAFVVALLFRLFSRKDINGAMVDVALTFTGVVYVAWLSAYAILLRAWKTPDVDGRQLIFFLFAVTWATDTGAYYVGRRLGRNKLYQKISPQKSWEGAVGGLLSGIGMSLLCRIWFYQALPLHDAFGLGIVLGIVGQAGDLAESMIKRSARTKDSGGIFPGHGGYLDRVDSMLLNAPALYYYTLVELAAKGIILK